MTSKETDIIELCIRKDRAAIERFYKLNYSFIFKTCLFFLRNPDDAKDATSNSFIKIFDKLELFDLEKGDIQFWMKKIAVNVCVDILRKQKKTPLFDLDEKEFEVLSESNSIESNIQLKQVMHFIENLDSPLKEIIKLYAIEGYSHNEISTLLNISEPYSRVLLSKARRLIKKNFLT